jgi:hypothetical protein
MVFGRGTSPYLKSGRLADVIAALQVMGAGERPEREIRGWARELSYSESQNDIDKWASVFGEHPKFFLVYHLQNDVTPKSTLRWRYTNRLYDSKTGKEYTPQEKEELPERQRWLLTTRPLTSDAVGALMNTAIELHSRAIEELSARRWWVPIMAACLGFGGALLGAIVSSLWGVHK